MPFPTIILRCVSILLAAVLFFTNSLFAHAPETSFWAERRASTKTQKRNSAGRDMGQLAWASLPSPAPLSNPRAAMGPKAPVPSIERLLPPGPGLSSALKKELSEVAAALPAQAGTIRSIDLPKNPGFQGVVLLAQDIHANPEAQGNLAMGFQRLFEAGAVEAVGLEGSVGPLRLAPFRSCPHPISVQKAAEFLFRQNKLSGPVLGALKAKGPLPSLIGVDDAAHYDQNVRALQRALPIQKKVQAEVARLIRDLNRQKAEALNPDLLAFDQHLREVQSGRLSLNDHLAFLARNAKPVPPAVAGYLEAAAMEKSLNFTQVEEQRNHLLGALLSRLDEGEKRASPDALVGHGSGGSS